MNTKFKRKDYIDASPFLESLTKTKTTITSFIEAIRLGEGLSQAEFARQLGISRSHLCDILQGRKNVSPARAAKFAKKLGYSEKQFITLALQDLIHKDKLPFIVKLEAA